MKQYQIMMRCNNHCEEPENLGSWKIIPDLNPFTDPHEAIAYLQSLWLLSDHDYRIEIIDR